MVAAALSQNNRAKIVGVTTKGYGAQKEGWTLQNKFRFRFITEMILGPDGTSFLGKGVSPDVYLPMAQDRILESRMAQRESERMRIDIQLAEAVRLVQGGR
jgi:C-terminal processing protease CtpA/Prc